MIIAKAPIKQYIKAQPTIDGLAQRLEVTRATLHNLLNGDNVSSELISKLLTETGFEFEKAFELKK